MYGTPSLKDPKPGDAVAYHNGRDKDPVKVAITKVTATQVVVDGCLRFMRSTGCLVGHSGRHAHIEPWTTEVEQRIAKRLASEALAERRKQVFARLVGLCFGFGIHSTGEVTLLIRALKNEGERFIARPIIPVAVLLSPTSSSVAYGPRSVKHDKHVVRKSLASSQWLPYTWTQG